MSAFAYAAASGGTRVPRPVVRRRFLMVAIALLAILGPLLGVSYLGSTGTSTTSITAAASSNLVYPVPTSSPPSAVTALKNSSSSAGTLPTWSPVVNTPGAFGAGDLALVDATAGSVDLNVYITNLTALAQDYQSFAMPINVYSCTPTSSSPTCSTWTPVSGAASDLLSSQPNYGIQLAAGSYYDVTVDAGGSYYCTSTSTSNGASLAPSFYFSAQAL